MKNRSPKTSTEPRQSLLSAIDIITVAFCGWIILYMCVGIAIGRAEDAQYKLPGYLGIFAGVYLLAYWDRMTLATKQPKLKRILSFVRGLYPVTLFGFFFVSNYSVNRILFGGWIDPWFQALDHAIFGYYPSLVWGKVYNSFWTSELFHFAYFAYYPMIGGLPLYLYFKKPEAFRELIFALTFSFYLFYFLFSLLPVVGGRFIPEAMELTKVYHGGLFTHIMAYIYNESQHMGGGFPSSHVGIAFVLTVSALRHVRKLGYLFAVISFFLALATVYCHYHWFVDMLGGVVTGISAYYLSLYVRQKIQEKLK